TIELAERLIAKGQDVVIIDFWGCCQPFMENVINRNIPYHILDKRDKPFLLQNSNKIKMLQNYFAYSLLWLSYRRKLKNILIKEQADFVVVNNAKTLSLLSKSKNYEIIYFARGWFLPNTVGKFNKILIKRSVSKFVG